MAIEFSEWNEPKLFTFPRNLRVLQWCLVVAGIIVYFLAAVRNLWVVAFLSAALVALSLLSLVLEIEKRWKDRDYQRLMKSVDEPNAVAAHIEVAQNGVLTGEDDGALWLQGGHLHFKGFATTFQIPSSLVSWTEEPRINEYPDRSIGLNIQVSEGAYRVKLGSSSSEKIRALYPWNPKDLVAGWLRMPSRSDEAILPPRAIRRRSLVKAQNITAEWLGVGLFSVYFFLEFEQLGHAPGWLRLIPPSVMGLSCFVRALNLQKKRRLQQQVLQGHSTSAALESALG